MAALTVKIYIPVKVPYLLYIYHQKLKTRKNNFTFRPKCLKPIIWVILPIALVWFKTMNGRGHCCYFSVGKVKKLILLPFIPAIEVVKPLVLGNKWYVSSLYPFSLATLLLASCFSGVNLVPSGNKRSCRKFQCENKFIINSAIIMEIKEPDNNKLFSFFWYFNTHPK